MHMLLPRSYKMQIENTHLLNGKITRTLYSACTESQLAKAGTDPKTHEIETHTVWNSPIDQESKCQDKSDDPALFPIEDHAQIGHDARDIEIQDLITKAQIGECGPAGKRVEMPSRYCGNISVEECNRNGA